MHFSDWMNREFVLPASNITDLSELTPENAALAIRSCWKLGEEPIPNMIALLESHGVRVFSVCEISDTIDAFSFWSDERNRPFVFLTTAKSAKRRRMDAAHELGHLVLHKKTNIMGTGTREIESEADRFASELLMPESGFRATLSLGISFDTLKEVKRYWKTSLAATVYRAHQLHLLSDWQYHNLFKRISKEGHRHSEPDGIEKERSQILDQIIEMYSGEPHGIESLSASTGLSPSDLLSLSFKPPLTAIVK